MAAKGADGEEVSQCLPDSRQRRPSVSAIPEARPGRLEGGSRGEARQASSSRSLCRRCRPPHLEPAGRWSAIGRRAGRGRPRAALGALRASWVRWCAPRARMGRSGPAPGPGVLPPRSVGRGPRRGVVATRPPDGHTPRPRHAPAPPPPRPCAPSSGGMRRSERRQGLNGARHPATPSGPQRRRYTPAGGVATPQEYPASRPWSHDAVRGNIPAAGRGARHRTDNT